MNCPPELQQRRRTLGTASIFLGLLLLGIYLVPTLYGSAMAHLAIARFRAQSSSNRLWDSARIRAYRQSLDINFPPPEAILRVPRVNIEVPVLEGTDGLTLNRGAGHLPGTALPGQTGNMAITGHRDGFFRGLKDLTPGDTIEVDRQGHTDRYLVRSIHVVSPSDTSVLAPTPDSTLTLITCYPFYFVGAAPQRYIVQASLVTTAQPASSRPFTPQETKLNTLCRYLKSAPLLAIALAASSAAPAFAATGESTVVYVSSGDVVVKSADGKLLNYTTPAGTMATVGGKKVPASGLMPGNKLSDALPGDPKPVTGVSVETGKVYQVDPPDKVTLSLAQGIKELSVPAGTTFTVGGKPVPVGALQKGMEVSATIVTVGSAAADTPPATPPQSGTLLLAAEATGESTLPEAGTNLPLFGVLGFSALLLGFALRSKAFVRSNP